MMLSPTWRLECEAWKRKMPTYDDKCRGCGHSFDELQSFSDPPLTKCPACKKNKLERLFGGGGAIIFKGTGFYETDYRRAGNGQANGKAGENGSTETKTETKAESTTAGDSSGNSSPTSKSDGTGTATTPKKDK
jgi:putative FmdB family regulatory protein